MRLGLFGGSFDPVHTGHLVLADSCAGQAALDEVWFVPAVRQPLKPSGPQASDADRLEMLRLALADRPRFEVSQLEIERGGMSYTVGVQVYRTSIAPRPHLKRQPPVTRLPEPSMNGDKKPRAGRRFDADQIRSIRQLAAGGVTRQQLGGRYGVDPSFIGEICRRVAYADVV